MKRVILDRPTPARHNSERKGLDMKLTVKTGGVIKACVSLLFLTACAGTHPDAVLRGYPAATINNTAGLNCPVDLRTSKRDLKDGGGPNVVFICNPYDGGFNLAFRNQLDEARREAKRNKD